MFPPAGLLAFDKLYPSALWRAMLPKDTRPEVVAQDHNLEEVSQITKRLSASQSHRLVDMAIR